MSNIKIEKDIPLPCAANGHGSRYPWADMEVGDSFFIPCADAAERRVRQVNVNASARSWVKRQDNGAQFTTRRAEDGVRVWRVK